MWRSTPTILALIAPALASADPCDDAAIQSETTQFLRDTIHAAAPPDPTTAATLRRWADEGRICTAEDAFLAATALKAGEREDLQRATRLARQAFDGGWKGAGWLLATTTDRWKIERGLAQSYGTMTAQEGDHFCIYPVDPSITDSQRTLLGARPLAESYARLLEKNGSTAPATAASIEAAGYWCATRAVDQTPTLMPQTSASARVRTGRDPHRTLTNGEQWGPVSGWSGNAWTVAKGRWVIHPFLRSGYGVADGVDIKTSILGFIAGPNLGVEVSPIRGDVFKTSLEGHVQSLWAFDLVQWRGVLHTSTAVGPGLLNVNGWAAGVSGGLDGPTLRAGPELGYDLHLGDKSSVVLNGRMDLLGTLRGDLSLAAGARYVYGGKTVGAAIGAEVTVFDPDVLPGPLQQYAPDAPTTYLPLPQLELWFKI